MKKKFLFFSFLLFVTLFAFIGCATTKQQYVHMDSYMARGEFQTALKQLEESREKGCYEKKDKLLFYLDMGLLAHFSGEYQLSNEKLEQADTAMEDLYTKSVSRAVGSAIVNENLKEYSGEDYEFVFINLFKALNYIKLKDNEAALVEIRKLDDKLKLLNDKYGFLSEKEKAKVNPFYASALARYLGILLYRTEHDQNEIDVESRLLSDAIRKQPNIYNFINSAKIQKLLSYPTPAPDEGVVSLIAFSGLSPEKVAKKVDIMVLGSVLTVEWGKENENYREMLGFTVLPLPLIPGMNPMQTYFFQFEFPEIKMKEKRAADKIVVVVDDMREIQLDFIEDIAKIARLTFENRRNATLAKTIVRATVKYLTVVVAAEMVKKRENKKGGNFAGELAGFALGLVGSAAASATEKADLRMSYFFPSKAFVSTITLPKGKHELKFKYYKNGALLGVDRQTINVKSQSQNILESFKF